MPKESLTKFIRLVVYSYLGFTDCLRKIATLSKKERLSLENSRIASEGKCFSPNVEKMLSRSCILHNGKVAQIFKKLKYALSITESIRVKIRDPKYSLYSFCHDEIRCN